MNRFNRQCRVRNLLKMASILLVVFLFGCGDNSPPAEESLVSPAGIWLGVQTVVEKDVDGTVVTNAFDMKTIIYDGRYYGISEGANIVFSGTYEMGENGRMISNGLDGGEHSYKMYSLPNGGESWVNGVARLDFIEKQSFSGLFQNDAYQEGSMEALYSSLYEKGASLENVTGTFASDGYDLTIDANGAISGNKNNCEISGAVSVPNAEVNIYDLNYSLSGPSCIKEGSFTGLGIVAVDSNNAAYFLGLTNNSDETKMDGVAYYLDDTPFSFTVARVDNSLSDFFGLEQGEKVSQKLMAAVNPDNWPSLVPMANAYLLLASIDKQPLFDLTESNFTDEEQVFPEEVLGTYDAGYSDFHNIQTMGANVNYSDSDFNELQIGIHSSGISSSLFNGADMENVDFIHGFWTEGCSFINTNLKGSNISSTTTRALTSFLIGNDYSGAWWEDGRRCGLDISLIAGDSICYKRIFDTGLTYAEWKRGKSDAEKAVEIIAEPIKDAVEKGVSFVEEGASSAVEYFTSWW